jgi:hypothetical protein
MFLGVSESLRALLQCRPLQLFDEPSAAQVALEKAGFKRPEWSHTALRTAFANELTRRRKLYSPFLVRHLTLGLEVRLVPDYEEVEVSRRQGARRLRWAKEFVKQVKDGIGHE